MKRFGIYGWGLVGPKSPDIESFAANLEDADSWLTPFRGFGPSNFLVGAPEFDFERYKTWVDERFLPTRYPQLVEKMDESTLFAIGAFIQALAQNPGLEEELQRLGLAAHVYVGTGLGSFPTIYDISIDLHRSQRRWDRFWAQPERNAALRAYLATGIAPEEGEPLPSHPDSEGVEDHETAEEIWSHYWAVRSEQLLVYLEHLREIESISVEGDVESGKLSVLKEKRRRKARLQKEWGAPDPPWTQVSPNVLFNIQNTPAAQISMLGKIVGAAFAPVAACSTFGFALKLAMDAIGRGDAKAVVVGATDSAPHPLTVGAFYGARVIAADGRVSKPLTGLRGTHVAGGAVVWVLGDYDHFSALGMTPLGMEPIAVGLSSDADHIITPSKEGPLLAVREALTSASLSPEAVATWDLHATATPGDYLEVENIREVLSESVLITARKGTFGHGMSAAGGWELTAQYLGYAGGKVFPTPLAADELNAEIGDLHRRFVFDRACAAPDGVAGKLSMGIGGVNACVLSRPWPR